MKVSIVTPSFNQGRYLTANLASVAGQRYRNIEHIVIDGGSTDESVAIIRQRGSHLSYWVSEPDGGQAAAINKGFRRATGDVLAWLNSDDLLPPTAVSTAVAFLEANPSCDIVCGFRWELFEPSGKIIGSASPEPTRFSIRRVCTVAQETVFFRRKVLHECGFLDESYQHCLDWEYWNRVVSNGFRFHLIPTFQGFIRRHSETKTVRQRDRRSEEVSRVYQTYLGRPLSESQAHRELGALWWLGYYFVRLCGRIGLLDRRSLAVAVAAVGRWACSRRR